MYYRHGCFAMVRVSRTICMPGPVREIQTGAAGYFFVNTVLVNISFVYNSTVHNFKTGNAACKYLIPVPFIITPVTIRQLAIRVQYYFG